jgi:hypothetical protein
VLRDVDGADRTALGIAAVVGLLLALLVEARVITARGRRTSNRSRDARTPEPVVTAALVGSPWDERRPRR